MPGLVKGEGFAVDASVLEANASRYHGKAPDKIEWAEPERQSRAVKEYLAGLDVDAQPNPDRKPPKLISPSDPCSAWTAKANKRVQCVRSRRNGASRWACSPSCAITGGAGNTGSGYPTRSAVARFCVMSDTGNGSAPGVMATRARAVHHRQRTARQEYYRGDNQ